MADNVEVDNGDLSDYSVSSDEAGDGSQVQHVKLTYSAGGSKVHVPADADGLLVNLGTNNDVTVAGVATQATLADILTDTGGILTELQGTLTVDGSGVTQPVSGTVTANLAAGSNNIGDVDVLSVVPGTGATALGKAVDSVPGATDTGVAALVVRDDALSSLTPADGDYTHLRTTSTGALWVAQSAALPAGTNNIGDVDVLTLPALPAGNNNIGDVDIASIAAGDNNIGNVDVVTLPALPAGTNNIGDVDIASIAAGDNNIGNVDVVTLPGGLTGYAEDAVAQSGDIGIPALAVRRDTPAANAADGDYLPLTTDSNGALRVTGGGGGTQYNVDDVAGATNTGTLALAVRDDALATLTPADGDYTQLRVDSTGSQWVVLSAALPAGTAAIGKLAANSGVDIGDVDVTTVVPGTGATQLGKAVDSATGATDTGVAALVVRDDALSTLTPADGDYTQLRVDSTGSQWVNVSAALPAGTNTIGQARSKDVSGIVDDAGTDRTVKYAIIDAASSGDNTLVSAVGSRKIRVLSAFLVAAGSVNVRFESGAGGTALTGQMNLVANTGFSLPYNPHGWFETAVNTLLNLELSGAVSVDGCLVYAEIA